jgi:hypothetical protein
LNRLSLLSLVSLLWLLNSAIGARVAVREGLPAEWVTDVYVGQDASAEFFEGTGTALSPWAPHDDHASAACGAQHTLQYGRNGRGRWADRAERRGTVGMLAETVTYRVLSPKTLDPARAAIVSATVILSPLMAIIGGRRTHALRRGR